MKRITVILAVLLTVSYVAGSDWQLFHGDSYRSGWSSEVTTAGLVELWQVDLGSPIYISPVVSAGRVVISTADARLVILDAQTGAEIWQTDPGSWLEASPTVFNGRVYVSCVDHTVYCFDLDDGSLIWSAETGSWVESSPLVFNDTVYIGSSDHFLYAFDTTNGSLLFRIESDFDVITAPSTDNQAVFYGGDDEKIHAISPDGTFLWTVDAGGAVYGAPVASEGKILYGSIANGEGLSYNRLVALDAAGGTELWRHEFAPYEFLNGTPAVAYGNVYIGDFQGNVSAYDINDGAMIWSRSLGDWALLSSPAVANGVVYIGSNSGTLYALDAFNGVVLDQSATGGFMQSSPGIADRRLFVGSADGILRAFSLDAEVEVIATPQTVTVPAGGVLPFDVEFNELQGQPTSFLAWMRITRPNGAQRDFGNPANVTLSSGQQFSTSAQLSIPEFAPTGDYFLTINVGSSQDIIWDASSFGFTITSNGDNPAAVDDWTFRLTGSGIYESATPPEIPREFSLHSPYPNPFNPATTVSFSLSKSGYTVLRVYNTSGKLTATLLDTYLRAGVHQVRWDATGWASGVYFLKLTSAGKTAVQRAVLTK